MACSRRRPGGSFGRRGGSRTVRRLRNTLRRCTITPKALQRWHACVTSRSPATLGELLADDAVFWSPVVYTPQRGKAIVELYLVAALQVLGNESFHYTKQLVQGNMAVLEFETVVDGITINGVDIITWNTDDQITEFKVMVRPLKAVTLLHQHMAAMLERLKQRKDA